MAAGSYTLTAKAYDNLNAATTSTVATVTVTGAVTRTNVALQANGGVATASSTVAAGYPASATNNGSRTGTYGSGGVWVDATLNAFPDWLQITFNGQKTIDEIDVITVQNVLSSTTPPTETTTFTLYGATAYDVQYWNGTAWVTVPGGSITGNNLVWRKLTFPAVTTDRIRVQVNSSVDGRSRLVEIEAYGY